MNFKNEERFFGVSAITDVSRERGAFVCCPQEPTEPCVCSFQATVLGECVVGPGFSR